MVHGFDWSQARAMVQIRQGARSKSARPVQMRASLNDAQSRRRKYEAKKNGAIKAP